MKTPISAEHMPSLIPNFGFLERNSGFSSQRILQGGKIHVIKSDMFPLHQLLVQIYNEHNFI